MAEQTKQQQGRWGWLVALALAASLGWWWSSQRDVDPPRVEAPPVLEEPPPPVVTDEVDAGGTFDALPGPTEASAMETTVPATMGDLENRSRKHRARSSRHRQEPPPEAVATSTEQPEGAQKPTVTPIELDPEKLARIRQRLDWIDKQIALAFKEMNEMHLRVDKRDPQAYTRRLQESLLLLAGNLENLLKEAEGTLDDEQRAIQALLDQVQEAQQILEQAAAKETVTPDLTAAPPERK